jgi:amidase
LTEILFDEAIERSRELDRHLKQTSKVMGPLHGLPVSIKDCFNIRGVDSSVGICALAFKPAKDNSTLFETLKAAGAVIHCKTAVPQALLALDTHSNLFGRTLNPYNTRLTAGGSSGGEGVLLAMRGSALGVGTDTGGSIRIPAMCNGLYSLKPSSQCVPCRGQETGQPRGLSSIGIIPTAGPLTHSLRDCSLFFNMVQELRPWEVDPHLLPFRWDNKDLSRTSREPADIRLGIVYYDGVVPVLPPVQNMLRDVGVSLRESGIQTVEMDLKDFLARCQTVAQAFLSLDGGERLFELLQATEEPLIPWLSPRLKRVRPRSLRSVSRLHAMKEDLQYEFGRYWRDEAGEILALICPIAPHPTPPIDSWNSIGYTLPFAMLDCPAGTVPVRLIQPLDLQKDLSTDDLTYMDQWNQKLCQSSNFEAALFRC